MVGGVSRQKHYCRYCQFKAPGYGLMKRHCQEWHLADMKRDLSRWSYRRDKAGLPEYSGELLHWLAEWDGADVAEPEVNP